MKAACSGTRSRTGAVSSVMRSCGRAISSSATAPGHRARTDTAGTGRPADRRRARSRAGARWPPPARVRLVGSTADDDDIESRQVTAGQRLSVQQLQRQPDLAQELRYAVRGAPDIADRSDLRQLEVEGGHSHSCRPGATASAGCASTPSAARTDGRGGTAFDAGLEMRDRGIRASGRQAPTPAQSHRSLTRPRSLISNERSRAPPSRPGAGRPRVAPKRRVDMRCQDDPDLTATGRRPDPTERVTARRRSPPRARSAPVGALRPPPDPWCAGRLRARASAVVPRLRPRPVPPARRTCCGSPRTARIRRAPIVTQIALSRPAQVVGHRRRRASSATVASNVHSAIAPAGHRCGWTRPQSARSIQSAWIRRSPRRRKQSHVVGAGVPQPDRHAGHLARRHRLALARRLETQTRGRGQCQSRLIAIFSSIISLTIRLAASSAD